MCTNAARHRLAAGPTKKLLEFGLRRAQGPDGAMSASKYSYMGGFDGTSNVQASVVYGIAMQGTHAHSFVTSFTSLREVSSRKLRKAAAAGAAEGEEVDFLELVLQFRAKLNAQLTNEGELAAFTIYALAFPHHFLALVDTYDTLQSGVPNFLAVALALRACGYQAVGVRLDSGDLAYLSREARRMFTEAAERFDAKGLERATIVASNDLTEEIIYSLNEQKHAIDSFGIGTNLVTCKSQPALGCVYKLVEINKTPRIKVSEDPGKVTVPCRKEAYRLFNAEGQPILDYMVMVGDSPPVPHKRILCRHPFDATKRAYVTPSRVELLHECGAAACARARVRAAPGDARALGRCRGAVWDGQLCKPLPSLESVRQRVRDQMQVRRPRTRSLRCAAARALARRSSGPTTSARSTPRPTRCAHRRRRRPCGCGVRVCTLRAQVSVSSDLYGFIHELWLKETPIREIQ